MNEKIPYLHWCGHDWDFFMEGGRIIHPDQPWVWYNKSCVKIVTRSIVRDFKKDILQLNTKPYDGKITDWQGTFHPQYSGGLIRSCDTFSYGTFSAEIMLPKGKGLWPAFWLCGEGPWPASGEIDIMEGYTDNRCFRLFTPYFPWINPSWTTTTNVHYQLFGRHCETKPRSISVFRQPKQPSDNWIRYEVKWTPNEIVFSIDGKVVRNETEAGKWFSTPDRRMRVIFDCFCLDPAEHKISCEQSMYIRNFNYTPIKP